jgi:hypothetical protein
MNPSNVVGTVSPPGHLRGFLTVEQGGIGQLLQVFFNLIIIGGGIYALFNFLLAGYAFMSAGDDPQKVSGAWKKIYQTIIGLVFLVGAFVIAALIGKIFYGSTDALIKPSIPTP